MLLWLAILVLCAATVLVLARPLMREAGAAAVDTGDLGRRAVYTDQLREIDADVARGLIGAGEAEAARIEISRRILSETAGTASTAGTPALPRPLRLAILAVLPIAAIGLYAVVGTPGLPARPYAEAVPAGSGAGAGNSEIERLVAQVEERLRQHPEDTRGWEVLGPVYLKLQRYDDARHAFARAIAGLGETPKRLIGLGESAIKAAGGEVTDEARDAFAKVLKAEPGRTEARFWLALAREQRGELAQAADEYRAILADAPADAPWRGAVNERLAATVAASQAAAQPGKGPTAAEIGKAGEMAPAARQEMIAGMVEGLHQRLKAQGKDAEGWQKLLRSYAVLGETAKAKAALSEARAALAGDAGGLAALDALARDMGLGS